MHNHVCEKEDQRSSFSSEIFLSKQDLGELNYFNHFHGAVESTADLTMGIVREQIAGGVAILRHKKLD